jgi:cyclohexadienyl dehydratase
MGLCLRHFVSHLKLCLAAAATLVMPCVAQAGAALDAIKTRGELRVGTTGDYKPFTSKEADGTPWGADIVMAGDLAAKLGVKLVLVPTIWAQLLDDQVAGKFDIAMGGVTITPPRAEKLYFSKPTFVDGKRPIARCTDKDKFKSVEDINRPDVRVIVNPGAQNEKFARENFGKAQLTIHKDNASVFDEIAAGRADVMVTDGIEVDHTSHTTPVLCPASVPKPFTRLEKAYMLPRDDELKVIVDAWLDEAQASGRWQKVLDAALAHR